MLYGFMYNQMFFRVDKIFVICRFFYLKTSFFVLYDVIISQYPFFFFRKYSQQLISLFLKNGLMKICFSLGSNSKECIVLWYKYFF